MSIEIAGNTYTGHDLKVKVATILNLPNTEGWHITDEKDGLVLVHHDDEPNEELSRIRGICVDVESGNILARSFGHTPNVVVDRLDNFNQLIDISDSVHSFNNPIVKRAFEGVVLRIMWWKGSLVRLTHRRINSEKSRWGNSPTFYKMYEMCKGPSAEQMFDTSKPYSSTYYTFMIVHPTLFVATRQKAQVPYLVLISTDEMVTNCDPEQISKGVSTFTTVDKVPAVVDESFILDQKALTLEEANYFLSYGYCDDTTEGTGESLIVYDRDADGNIIDVVKVMGSEHHRRCLLRDNSPNLTHRFYQLLDMFNKPLYSQVTRELFAKFFNYYPLYTKEEISEYHKCCKGIFSLPITGMIENYFRKADRFQLIWLNFLVSLPIHRQSEVFGLLDEYYNNIDVVANWMAKLIKEDKMIHDKITQRAVNIMLQAKNYSTQDYSKKSLRDIIYHILSQENPNSFYSLCRSKKHYEYAMSPTLGSEFV